MVLIINKEMNVFEKMKAIEEQIKSEMPFVNIEELPAKFLKIKNYVVGNVRSLNENEQALRNFLLRNKLNQNTIAHWFMLRDVPSDLKNKILDGKIWLRNASREASRIKKYGEKPKDESILFDIRRYVREVVRW